MHFPDNRHLRDKTGLPDSSATVYPMTAPTGQTAAVIFDKDGTLLDFHASWDAAIGAVLDALTGADTEARKAVANELGYDLANRRVLPGSPIIAESNEHIIGLAEPHVAHLVEGSLEDRFNELVGQVGVTMVSAAEGAQGLLMALAQSSRAVGLATNDGEGIARAQLDHLGWTGYFDAIVGYDSGFGAKPAPGMVVGCANLLQVDPTSSMMVGDSPHDLIAARDAGAMAVLVGENAEALPHADLQVASLSDLGRHLGL